MLQTTETTNGYNARVSIPSQRDSKCSSQIATWLTNTLNCVPDGLLATNPCGKVLFMNSQAEELTGWPIEQALHERSSVVFPLLDGRKKVALENPLREAYIEEQEFRCSDSFLVRADGQQLPIAFAAAPLRTETGEVIGALVLFRRR